MDLGRPELTTIADMGSCTGYLGRRVLEGRLNEGHMLTQKRRGSAAQAAGQ